MTQKDNQKSLKTRAPRRVFTNQEKCEAVLSVWTERRKALQVCRELKINWGVLNHWQTQAMAGMMAALETRKTDTDRPALGPKLEKLLQRTVRENGKISKLKNRLERIHSSRRQRSGGST